MRNNYLSYDEIVNYFGKDKVAERYKVLHDKMQEYINARGLEEKLYINKGILQQTVMDYLCDIYRMKTFHKINKADTLSMLAYQSYWILRRKPIQVQPEEDDRKLIFCNEGFTTTMLAHEFMIPKETEHTEEQEKILMDFLREMNYYFRYRSIDKQEIELMLYSFQTGQRMSE